MDIKLLTDKEIVADLGRQFDMLRRRKGIQDKEIIAAGGTNHDALDKFRNAKGNITIATLVKMMRGIGELDRLSALFSIPEYYSPTGMNTDVPKRRIRKKASPEVPFTWGDDQ